MSKEDGWYRANYRINPTPILPANIVCIYALCEPLEGTYRYIGATSRWPFARFMEHMLAARPGARPIATSEWIKELQSQGLMPECRIIMLVSDEAWAASEQRLISEYRNTLLNISDGGPGSTGPMSPEHRDAIARGTLGVSRGKGKPKSAEHRAAISAAATRMWEKRRASQA